MKSAVTISLVPEARGGPFVFWDGAQPARKLRATAIGAIILLAIWGMVAKKA